METRRIKARNGEGLTFSVVGEGTGPLGDFYELLDEKTSIATIEQALASGVKVFDSSPHYGNGLAEARMGAGLRRAKRDEILVSTKIGRIMDPFTKPPKPRSDVVSPGFAGGHPHAPRFDYSYDGAMRSIEHSLLAHGARPARHRSHSRLRRLDAWQGRSAGALQGSDGGQLSRARQAAQRKGHQGDRLWHQRSRHLRQIRQGRRFRRGDDGRTLYADRPDGLDRNFCRSRSKRTWA